MEKPDRSASPSRPSADRNQSQFTEGASLARRWIEAKGTAPTRVGAGTLRRVCEDLARSRDAGVPRQHRVGGDRLVSPVCAVPTTMTASLSPTAAGASQYKAPPTRSIGVGYWPSPAPGSSAKGMHSPGSLGHPRPVPRWRRLRGRSARTRPRHPHAELGRPPPTPRLGYAPSRSPPYPRSHPGWTFNPPNVLRQPRIVRCPGDLRCGHNNAGMKGSNGAPTVGGGLRAGAPTTLRRSVIATSGGRQSSSRCSG